MVDSPHSDFFLLFHLCAAIATIFFVVVVGRSSNRLPDIKQMYKGSNFLALSFLQSTCSISPPGKPFNHIRPWD